MRKLLSACALVASVAQAAPISFLLTESGNQRDVEWQTLESSRFRLYHDKQAEGLARFGLNSVEEAWPDFKQILGVRLAVDPPLTTLRVPEVVSRFDVIPIVMSTRTDVGGFANFATQNIEVQIKTGSNAALFQHELVHRMMYERLDPMVGPAGRTFTLAMVPTWWIEGTAEYLTESVGRLETEGLIRFQALQNYWPTWDSLHNLYSAGGDYGRGYATSGRFFGFLMDKAEERPMASIQDEFFWKTLTPPFMTATGNIMSSIWHKTGPELYDDFRREATAKVRQELNGMPALRKSTTHAGYLAATGIMRSRIFADKIVTPELQSKPYPSALIVTDVKSGKSTRLVVEAEGSSIADIEKFDPDGKVNLWTAKSTLFSNGVRGDQLLYISMEFVGPTKAELKRTSVNEINVSSENEPFEILQIESRPHERLFALANLRGEYRLLFVDLAWGRTSVLRTWKAGELVKLVKLKRSVKSDVSDCVRAIVEDGDERTSIERICSDGTHETQLPKEKFVIRDGFELSDDSLLLLVGWGRALGLIRVQADEMIAGFPFPEWAGGVLPWGADDESFGAWIFNGEGYYLNKISWTKAQSEYRQWSSGIIETSPWRQLPRWHPYSPPFVKIASRERDLALRSSTIFGSSGSRESGKVGVPEQDSVSKRTVQKTDAPQRIGHFFTYPTVIPPYFGGWSLGLASVPFQDEMERQSLRLFAQYNVPTGRYSVSASYLNNRLFDGFTVSAFSQAKFNGYYFWTKSEKANAKWKLSQYPVDEGVNYRLDNYLRESGLELITTHKLRPSSVVLSPFLKIAGIEPYDEQTDRREIAFLGAQNALLGSAGFNISATLGEKAFYVGEASELGKPYLLWSTTGSVALESTRSLGATTDYDGEPADPVAFERYRVRLTSGLTYDEQSLTLRGTVGLTSGSKPMNYRELYQPYQTYLLGSGMGFNNLNYFLAWDGNLFERQTGAHSFGTSVDYSFPLISEVDKQILIVYINTLRGEIVFSHGGVSRDESFKEVRTIDSASFAARATLDIKGFQILPSLAYGRILGRSGWAVFSEIAFSEFF